MHFQRFVQTGHWINLSHRIIVDNRALPSHSVMTGNALSTLLSGNFSAYPSLETLILDDNLLEEIPPDGLDSLPQLISL